MSRPTWFHNILQYVDKSEEGRVTMTVVSDLFFTLRSIEDGPKCDHYRRYTASNSEPIFHTPPAASRSKASSFSDRVKRYRRSSSWEEDHSPPCLCRPVPSLTEGPEQTIVGGGGQTRDTYNDDFLDILEPDADKQLK